MRALLALLGVVLVSPVVLADDPLLDRASSDAALADEDPRRANETRRVADGDTEFGPEITLERIDVIGNDRTSARLIREVLGLVPGETLRAGDPRLRASRFRVLSLGYFCDVTLRLGKGARRGGVVLTVAVEERGTFTVGRILVGTSEATPVWLGLDVGDANVLGTGLGVGVAGVWADAAEVDGAKAQRALRVRVADPRIAGSPFGAHASLALHDASEPIRTGGPVDDGAPGLFRAFPMRRVGGVVGLGADLTRLSRLGLDLRMESIAAKVPEGTDVGLVDGDSRLVTAALGFTLDTRADPVLPYAGSRVLAAVEAGAAWIGSDYSYARLTARAEHWFPLGGRAHVVSVHASAGLITGAAPRFERFYPGDFNQLVPPRALDLVVSTRPSRNLFDTRINEVAVGEVAASAVVEYSYRLFRRQRRVYGGDLFVAAGVFGLGRRDDLATGVPLDLTLDAGLRLDTEIGVFELSLGNGLGRIPL